MRKSWRGFTLIEVSLFLVITAAVFVGVAVGTQNSIFQQRYNDSVQNYVEFLRTVYSQVTNVQNENTGRSDKAIYGKLVTFGENEGNNRIRTYNVIGSLENNLATDSGGVLERLFNLKANVINEDTLEPVGFVDDYTPRWSAQIQTTAGWDNGYKIFEGALLIVRSPSSGTIYTYVKKGETINVEDSLGDFSTKNPFSYKDESGEKNYLTDGSFRNDEAVDFCINPNGSERSNLRRDVRLVANARNSSGIEVVSDEENACER